MKVEYVIKNDSHQDGTFYADGQWITLVPGSITVVSSRPADMSLNLSVVKKLVDDKSVVLNSPHKPTVVTKTSKPLNGETDSTGKNGADILTTSDSVKEVTK